MFSDIARRAAGGCALALALAATPLRAAGAVTGPDPAPGQDERAAGTPIPSTVYRDADGTPYVLKGPDEKQHLAGYNVTWIDKNHVIAPPGVGGFD